MVILSKSLHESEIRRIEEYIQGIEIYLCYIKDELSIAKAINKKKKNEQTKD